jgi:hypothetical protein
VIKLKFIDHLSRDEIQKFNQLRHATRDKDNKEDIPKPKKKKKENFSYRELEEMMGTRRDTFKRVRGAVRRK